MLESESVPNISRNFIDTMSKYIKDCMERLQDVESDMDEMLEYLSHNTSEEMT